jgi:hypothetical protein
VDLHGKLERLDVATTTDSAVKGDAPSVSADLHLACKLWSLQWSAMQCNAM